MLSPLNPAALGIQVAVSRDQLDTRKEQLAFYFFLNVPNQYRRARERALSNGKTFFPYKRGAGGEGEDMNTSGKDAGSRIALHIGRALCKQRGHAFQNHCGSVTASAEGKASFVIGSKGRKANPTESAFRHTNPVLSCEQHPSNYLCSTDGDRGRETCPHQKGNRFQSCNFNTRSFDPQPCGLEQRLCCARLRNG